MAQFTRIDRNLLVRVSQSLRERAGRLRARHLPWTTDPDSKKKRAEFDRLIRDSQELDDLRKRLEHEYPEMARFVPAVAKAAGGASG